jgi:Methyltransferase domain
MAQPQLLGPCPTSLSGSAMPTILTSTTDTVDVVVEHEALPFTDALATVLDEIQRVLRSGGLLLRILVHPVEGDDPTALIDTANRLVGILGGALLRQRRRHAARSG